MGMGHTSTIMLLVVYMSERENPRPFISSSYCPESGYTWSLLSYWTETGILDTFFPRRTTARTAEDEAVLNRGQLRAYPGCHRLRMSLPAESLSRGPHRGRGWGASGRARVAECRAPAWFRDFSKGRVIVLRGGTGSCQFPLGRVTVVGRRPVESLSPPRQFWYELL